jgi:hypothetical protein
VNAADLARLELAKRAYKATQATDVEIQIGVRRARLSQSRVKPRRAWFSKGLVFVVLAIGSLAYAKPHALGELVEKVLPRSDAAGADGSARGATALIPPPDTEQRATANANGVGRAAQLPAQPTAAPVAVPETPREARSEATPEATPQATATSSKTAKQAGRSASGAASTTPVAAPAERATPERAEEVSEWGRVGRALAHDDQAEALTALNQLSESDDQRTRDKADLGRAQLLMARGDQEAACKLASSLTHRRAGSRIERAAQVLLKSCTR